MFRPAPARAFALLAPRHKLARLSRRCHAVTRQNTGTSSKDVKRWQSYCAARSLRCALSIIVSTSNRFVDAQDRCRAKGKELLTLPLQRIQEREACEQERNQARFAQAALIPALS
jgi:hypothetical protein